jgi:hypothetical protein
MNHNYDDIRSRIQEPPKWFDECAVPRYSDFAPHEVSDIYAHEAALVLIACQSCGQRFKVAFSRPTNGGLAAILSGKKSPTLAERIKDKSLHYGDPPNVGCCPAGPTMNSDPILVLEYWSRPSFEWVRDHQLEIPLEGEQ